MSEPLRDLTNILYYDSDLSALTPEHYTRGPVGDIIPRFLRADLLDIYHGPRLPWRVVPVDRETFHRECTRPCTDPKPIKDSADNE